MANFEAYFHAMAVGTSNKYVVNMKIMTRTLQPEANGKFGKEKVKKKVVFLRQNIFFRKLSFFLDPKCYTLLESLGCV